MEVLTVAPLAGAWIEILWNGKRAEKSVSLPSRERGLKSFHKDRIPFPFFVAPLAGAWIEIQSIYWMGWTGGVAPLAGAWIEIMPFEPGGLRPRVAPLAGAWIEMSPTNPIKYVFEWSLPSRERGLKLRSIIFKNHLMCRSPRGSVD